MRLFYIGILTFLLFFISIEQSFALKFKLEGTTYSWENFGPASRTTIGIDTKLDSLIQKKAIDSVKITILYGSTFTAVDTSKPIFLEPVSYSLKNGSFVIKGNIPEEYPQRLCIIVEKPGYLSFSRYFDIKKGKTDYQIEVVMVKKVTFNK